MITFKPLTKKVANTACSDRHKEAVDRWRTIPGVSMLTAITYQAEMMDLDRFDFGKEIGMMLGLVPRIESSGQHCWSGPIIKAGKKRLRSLLVRIAWRWVSLDLTAQEKFLHIYENTRSKKKAIVAMARRLAVIMWRMYVNKETYRRVA